MRSSRAWWLGWLALCGSLLNLPGTHGQPQPTAAPPAAPATPAQPKRDLSQLPPLARQMHLSARRGADWLFRANRPDGRFVDGFRPELNAPLSDTHYLRQIGAAGTLARAAVVFEDERFAARGRQGVLALLLDTIVDPADATARYPVLPVDRLAATGLLLAAISEVPQPGNDLLTQGDQLVAYLRRGQQPDGSLRLNPGDNAVAAGTALYGLARSNLTRPAAWKLDLIRKALPYYREEWRGQKNLDAVPPLTAAFTEAYLATKEAAFAEYVFEMNDWLCGRQCRELDPRQPWCLGGFRTGDGTAPPHIDTGIYAEAMAEACRVARQAGDLDHYNRFRESLERALQFLTTLQYTEANTQHFADWYRPTLLGGFYAAHQDGHLRIDYTQHAVAAMLRYLKLGD
jgi:hypothetical protein